MKIDLFKPFSITDNNKKNLMDAFYRSEYKHEEFYFVDETVELYLKNVIANVK